MMMITIIIIIIIIKIDGLISHNGCLVNQEYKIINNIHVH
jgi:hypothetical protein